ncbi:MAG: HAD family hydrolase [Christensenellaceae bacterium]|nr:HAD family hydrolase [Christensenellaceae bacterium]
MAVKAALFDLDGTLTNTLDDIANAMNRALRLHGLPEFPVNDYRYLVGDGVKKLAERASRGRTELEDSVRREYQQYYQAHTQVLTAPYDGVPDMLRELQRRGVRLAVFSNKPHADTCGVVAHYFPDVAFDIVRGQMEGVPVKPDPAGALAIAEAMAIAPDEFVYLGDTGTDMRCAVNAGMRPIGVLWGFRTAEELLESGAEALLEHPSQLMGLLGMSD